MFKKTKLKSKPKEHVEAAWLAFLYNRTNESYRLFFFFFDHEEVVLFLKKIKIAY